MTQMSQIRDLAAVVDVRDPKRTAIIGAAMEVHSRLGAGFLEQVYQEALAIEFAERGVPFEREVAVPIAYRDVRLNTTYRADFVCFGEVIVELKALRALGGADHAQRGELPEGDGTEARPGDQLWRGAARIQAIRALTNL